MPPDIPSLLGRLAQRRPIFHSEADFQHELAWQAREDGASEVRLERPIGPSRVNLDVLLRWDGKWIGIELKYFARKTRVAHRGEHFELAQQGAQDQRRYDFWKDVARLETLVGGGLIDSGSVIALSADPGYWKPAKSITTGHDALRLHDGRSVTGTLCWGAGMSPGTMRGRTESISLLGSYDIAWREYSVVSEATLKSLLLAVTGIVRGRPTSEKRRAAQPDPARQRP